MATLTASGQVSNKPCYIKNLFLRGGVGGTVEKVTVKIYDVAGTVTAQFKDADLIEELEVYPTANKDQRVYGDGRQGMLRCHWGAYAVITGSYGELTYNLG